MAMIDLDSHPRDGWLLDEIYELPEPLAQYSPSASVTANIRMPNSSISVLE